MPNYKYLIIGGGMTADAAVQGIREHDSNGSIGIISAEAVPPYDRPPLSKGLWKQKSMEEIWRKTEEMSVTLHLDRTIHTLEPDRKRVVDDQGKDFTYEKLLLATGGSPRRLPFGNERIIYYRTLADYQRLRELTEKKKRFLVIGGGFIGSEIAAALAMNDKQAVMVFPEVGVGGLTFPADLAHFLNDYYQERGVEVLAGELANDLSQDGEQLVLKTKNNQEIVADEVIAGIGIEPNVELARQAGVNVENGILVDKYLRTNVSDIYAAGDVAAFYNPALSKRIRVEHEDNANTMGRMAGQAMAGAPAAYNYLPYFYSDLFDLGYEAVGELNPELDTVADWQEPYRKGVIYYLEQGRVRGVILWNVWEQVDAARALIAEPGPFKPEDLKGRIP